jgi:DNA ligase-1
LLQPASSGPAANEPTLQILETDRLLDEVAKIRGPGSQATRTTLAARIVCAVDHLGARVPDTTCSSGIFGRRALAGVMVDAIAFASSVSAPGRTPRGHVCRNLGVVARVALLEGGVPLEQFQLAILSPIAPMLAQTAADVADALQQLEGDVAFDWKMDGARIQVHRFRGRDPRIYA